MLAVEDEKIEPELAQKLRDGRVDKGDPASQQELAGA